MKVALCLAISAALCLLTEALPAEMDPLTVTRLERKGLPG
jgi:hypothetical protein